MKTPAATLFDFDGVIVDSERLHCETMAAAMGGDGPAFGWDFYRERLIGFDDRGSFALLLERAGIEPTREEIGRRMARKAALFAERAAAGGAAAFPGAVELIRSCAAAGPVGLCSGALRGDVDPALGALGVAECFAEMVTAEDVERSKPDPACYRLCVARLAERFPGAGIAPGTVVAIEDTVDGIAAALGAGIAVVGVGTHLPPERLRAAGATAAVETLEGLTFGGLARLVGGRH